VQGTSIPLVVAMLLDLVSCQVSSPAHEHHLAFMASHPPSGLYYPTYWMSLYGLIGFKTGNICVFAPAAGSPSPSVSGHPPNGSGAIELIY
jgi:hypothetical protein